MISRGVGSATSRQRWASRGRSAAVGSGEEADIATIADLVLAELDLPASLKTIVPDRPSHDRRYLLDSTKIRIELGWKPQVSFADGVGATVGWYREHPEWWQPLLGRSPVQEAAWAPGGSSS